MHDLDLHQHLIGRQGSRADLNTPVLVVDLDALDRNIAAMAAFAAERGVALRPHAKTHKSVEIARRQIAKGAVGACCAKLGEAEALAAGGIESLLLTSPVVGAAAIDRLTLLNNHVGALMAVADHPANVRALGAAARAFGGRPLAVVVDIDPGFHRTGVATPDDAVALARLIAGQPALRFAGVQFYCGADQHIAAFEDRRASVAAKTRYLSAIVERLRAEGLAPGVITGSGTGTHAIDAALGVFTEFQVGSYAFMDSQYSACDLTEDGAAPFETALMVDARVVSASHAGFVTVDAGLKAFATEAGPPRILSGAAAGSTYHFTGDEHGAVVPPKGEAPPALGEVVTFAAPHCDPTVNLYDAYHVVRGDTLVEIWPIQARGRSR
ncbi:MAG TPA: DSD1 family PLP-dependent enzyme [Caulobacteraceae bacterium]|jgi:D-serine deaminase-like pyridoxal phosphate-dependent protein|nr:DSD1 family PLP-dependent enzyme [Caulobacteraceae bacterium]